MVNYADATAKIAQVEGILNYVFQNKLLCASAIQMVTQQTDFLYIAGQLKAVEGNERLAILGDSVLAMWFCKKWYNAVDQHGNRSTKSMWTAVRNEILSNTALARRADELGIGAVIIAHHGYFEAPSTKMLATTIEALVGAAYEDGGQEVAQQVIRHLFPTPQPH